MTPQTDPRIAELLELAASEGLPLAVRPETVCALEDIGYTVNPFSGAIWRDPRAGDPNLVDMVRVAWVLGVQP